MEGGIGRKQLRINEGLVKTASSGKVRLIVFVWFDIKQSENIFACVEVFFRKIHIEPDTAFVKGYAGNLFFRFDDYVLDIKTGGTFDNDFGNRDGIFNRSMSNYVNKLSR